MKEDFTQTGERYDVILDVVGKSPYAASLRALKENGRYLIANPGLGQMLRARLGHKGGGKQVITGTASQTTQDLLALTELVESGVVTPVVDRTYPLEQAVEAHRYVESGMKVGCVVLEVG